MMLKALNKSRRKFAIFHFNKNEKDAKEDEVMSLAILACDWFLKSSHMHVSQ